MDREQAFREINETQDFYVKQLIDLIFDSKHSSFKILDFSSPTGTGKTMMMAKLMNLMPNKFFIITTLSKGQLNRQVKDSLERNCKYQNYVLYGNCDYKTNTKIQAEDILSKIPSGCECIWLRDEGHIKTNRFEALLINRCFKVINFSATNIKSDIKCNFTNTMMLRTVHQCCGTPKDAIQKLVEIKKFHKDIKKYNPCAIFRCVDSKTILKNILKWCDKYSLKYINITDEDFDMSDLCRDDNEYDVIINKFKLVEGVDIRRAHVLYMDNQPTNPSTTIQAIGRCRRNALLYREDVDIFDNPKLLDNTMQCFVFYNVENMKIDSDENGELEYAFCDTISCEQLKPNSTIEVKNGKMPNGLNIIELAGMTGKFEIKIDESTGFNIVKPEVEFYDFKVADYESNVYVYSHYPTWFDKKNYFLSKPIKIKDIKSKLKRLTSEEHYDYFNHKFGTIACEPYFNLNELKDVVKPYEQLEELREQILKEFSKKIESLNKVIVHKWKSGTKYEVTHFADCFGMIDIGQMISKGEDVNSIVSFILKNSFFTRKYSKKIKCEQYDKQKILESLKRFCDNLPSTYKTKELIIDYRNHDFALTESEFRNFRKNHICFSSNGYSNNDSLFKVPESALISQFKEYSKIVNDRESSIIGVDGMKLIRNEDGVQWIEDRAVTNKVIKFCKFNMFIEKTYSKQIDVAKTKLFDGKNIFNLDKKCNTCLGYCVEYYSKYLVYGTNYLARHISLAKEEAKTEHVTDAIVVRACMLKYRELMANAFGTNVSKVIKTIGVQQLINDSYNYFVSTVVELGTKTAKFVKENLYIGKEPKNVIDPNLSVEHITGLADYLTEEVILDVKATNRINLNMIKQALAYHYLSTKRSDLQIKKVIVYDAVSDRCVSIDI